MPRPKKPRRPCKACSEPVKRAQDLYCDNSCQHEFQYRKYIERWKKGLESGNAGSDDSHISKHVRRYLMEKYEEACSRCGWAEKNSFSQRIPLTVEHKDGNWRNTAEKNLDLICPNCHSLTPTYGKLNNGRGRSYRYS